MIDIMCSRTTNISWNVFRRSILIRFEPQYLPIFDVMITDNFSFAKRKFSTKCTVSFINFWFFASLLALLLIKRAGRIFFVSMKPRLFHLVRLLDRWEFFPQKRFVSDYNIWYHYWRHLKKGRNQCYVFTKK